MSESDSIEEFLEKNKRIHAEFLNFLDNEEDSEGNFENLNKIFDNRIYQLKFTINNILLSII